MNLGPPPLTPTFTAEPATVPEAFAVPASPGPEPSGITWHGTEDDRYELTTDDSGAPIPPEVADVFGSGRSMFAAALHHAREAKEAYLRLCSHRASATIAALGGHLQTLAELEQDLRNSVPSLVCVDCDGDGCQTCDQLGWLPRRAR